MFEHLMRRDTKMNRDINKDGKRRRKGRDGDCAKEVDEEKTWGGGIHVVLNPDKISNRNVQL